VAHTQTTGQIGGVNEQGLLANMANKNSNVNTIPTIVTIK